MTDGAPTGFVLGTANPQSGARWHRAFLGLGGTDRTVSRMRAISPSQPSLTGELAPPPCPSAGPGLLPCLSGEQSQQPFLGGKTVRPSPHTTEPVQ